MPLQLRAWFSPRFSISSLANVLRFGRYNNRGISGKFTTLSKRESYHKSQLTVISIACKTRLVAEKLCNSGNKYSIVLATFANFHQETTQFMQSHGNISPATAYMSLTSHHEEETFPTPKKMHDFSPSSCHPHKETFPVYACTCARSYSDRENDFV